MDYFLFDNLEKTKSFVCGCAMLNPGWTHMSRKLETDTVIILGKKNNTFLTEEGTEIEIKPGRIVLLPAGFHHEGSKIINERVSYYWLHFSQGCPPKKIDENCAKKILSHNENFAKDLEGSALLPHWLDLPSEEIESVTQLFNKLLVDFSLPNYNKIQYNTGIQQLLVYLTQLCINKARGTQINKKNVNQIIVKIEENLTDPNSSVKYIADLMKLNCDYLGRIFKEVMHISVGKYIVKRRIEIAINRLRETRLTSKEIADQCGFGSLRQFYHHFKAETGKTPGEYRDALSKIEVNVL